MRVLVTGSAGHLGEALVRALTSSQHEVVGLDILRSPFTTHIGSITDRACVRQCMQDVRAVFHAATLHKPHVATHRRQNFIDTNVTGTLNLLEEAVAAGVESFVYTSTTSVFGDALVPPPGAAAAWVTEEVTPVPKNIYGVTKAAAEDLCQLFHRNQALACVVLRTSRFFPEQDDNRDVREAYPDDNVKMNEYLHRRVAIEDVVTAHLLASERAPALGFRKYIVSATTPFQPDDLLALRVDAPRVVRQRVPDYEAEYERRGWKMSPSIGRVYVNDRAQRELGWQPRYNFNDLIGRLSRRRFERSSGADGWIEGLSRRGVCRRALSGRISAVEGWCFTPSPLITLGARVLASPAMIAHAGSRAEARPQASWSIRVPWPGGRGALTVGWTPRVSASSAVFGSGAFH
jgi:nucleoside-diphosphate-sugar epimerase